MKCKNHPTRNAEKFCASCNIPICDDCAEEVKPGQHLCFNCAMLQTVSVGSGSLIDKKQKAQEKEHEKKRKSWGPFHYFVLLSCVLISVMWVVILFGGEKAPGQKMDYSKKGRVLLFMVDSSIRRYYHYENKAYPDDLLVLAPKYLRMAKEDLHYLSGLSYKKEPATGYTLSLVESEPGSMNIILSPQGIKYGAEKGGVE
jgi:hypothetical protein